MSKAKLGRLYEHPSGRNKKMMRAELKALQRIRKLIVATHWFKYGYHQWRDKWGRTSDVARDGYKESFCLVGFVNKEAGIGDRFLAIKSTVSMSGQPMRQALLADLADAIVEESPYTRAETIEDFNDSTKTSRDRVLRVVDRAIAKLEAQLKS